MKAKVTMMVMMVMMMITMATIKVEWPEATKGRGAGRPLDLEPGWMDGW